ncbi:hypothetical protein GS429_21520 [Natronorubrum sp. JWXQ-INN-674]|uniref:Uncharacterized protein n=1 Tax=Natronorubrum halalkaliphilum TaxID=2691917 RepID=A0A6B0VUK6_9EURY|nr:hypothetical protein [Natronorubrum halalkaliphilum]MXV64606.1 hypothetical protein [Natronorubrum halalkaliphilum]
MTDSGPETTRETETDGSASVDIDQDELYTTVRTAVTDAMLAVLGTVALLGFAVLFVYAGARLLFATPSTAGGAAGVAGIGLGFAIAAAALELLPPFRE